MKRDSNPHCTASETVASYQLGYSHERHQMNMFGIGPKGLFWLRLTSNISGLGVITTAATESGGKWAVIGLALVGLICGAVSTGNPEVK